MNQLTEAVSTEYKTMTLGELIARLTELQAEHGPDVQILKYDDREWFYWTVDIEQIYVSADNSTYLVLDSERNHHSMLAGKKHINLNVG